jgi:formate hydrogenlyase transcriptional activator
MTPPEDQAAAHLKLRGFIDHVSALGWSALPDGCLDYVNASFREYAGFSPAELYESAWKSVLYQDDVYRFETWWQNLTESQQAGTIDVRLRRFDAEYRRFQITATPVYGEQGNLICWCGIGTDINEMKCTEQQLYQQGLDLTITDAIPVGIVVLAPGGAPLYMNRLALDRVGLRLDDVKAKGLHQTWHPDDRERVEEQRRIGLSKGIPFALEFRLLPKSGEYRWYLAQYNPLIDETGKISRWYTTAIDINDRKLAEEKLRKSEEDLRTMIDAIRQYVVVISPDGEVLHVNRVALEITGVNPEVHGFSPRVFHNDDVERVRAERKEKLLGDTPFDLELRLLLKDGQYRWFLFQYEPFRDDNGRVIRWYVTATDIDDRKKTEERLRREGDELRTITDAIRQPIAVLAPDGKALYANRVGLDLTGLTIEDIDKGFFPRIFHPEDLDRLGAERQERLSRGVPFELEMRMLSNGQYRWQLILYNPLKDNQGNVIRWYATATDIDDRKKTEERLQIENVRLARERVYLEEQIRSEMGYEQIIGSSPSLKHVLELVETVAPSDSTVLLLGETGTGKELIARAVHERSRRKAKTFVKLNCAAIPTGLLESELFGHEKGAFTGAIIQKVGRMELADQGTLFLDEVGDIPVDIQPKLLRALQEREFERLGSTHTRKVNLRLVAATNRDLEKMVADREFRSDLFYRLNVFPIRIPPLRHRKEDIPLLVSYFVQKFSKQMQKRIDSIPVATMKALASWDWPGNIRELENFIERAVILTHGESLSAPLSELRKMTTDEPVRESDPHSETDIARIVKETIASLKGKGTENERGKKQHEEIVRALTECKGRVGGTDGAAVRMGLSRTTLISRMKKLGINPYDYD